MRTKAIPGFGRYEVSDDGWVRNEKGRILRSGVDGRGYTRQPLVGDDGKVVCLYVHRLVADAFVEGRADGFEVDHIDGDASNNRAENLRWVSRAENMRLAFERRGNWLLGCKRKVVGVEVLKGGELVGEFPSITAAVKALMPDRDPQKLLGNISHAMRGDKEAYGFMWRRKG